MDSFRGFESEVDLASLADDEPIMDTPPDIGVDERRMHVRAYNYWVSLLGGRSVPSIADVHPENLEDFGPNSVLLDFTGSSGDPRISFLGRALRAECGIDLTIKRISQVPKRSLLSRLTDHYMQILANSAPIGFEAEFVSHSGHNTMYRGILMPLSSDGEKIDFIYGVINWKELADTRTTSAIASAVDRAIAAPSAAADCPVWADGPNAEFKSSSEPLDQAIEEDNLTLGLWEENEQDVEGEISFSLPEDAGLGDRLSLARESAEHALASDQRSRAALYRALGFAYDFALAAEASPEDYAELLDDAGLKVQARAPMTPLVKLVFGAGYDKTRLTEFAAALTWGRRSNLAEGGFADYLDAFQGGLKGVVQAERKARRPEPKPSRAVEIRDRLRTAPAFAHVEIEAEGGEFVLLLARREGENRLAIVAPIQADEATLDRFIRKSAA